MKVSIVKCSNYEPNKVYNAIKKALALIDYEIKPNQKVLIKPNLLQVDLPHGPITVNPIIVDAICKILKEKNCKIFIGDSSAYDTGKALDKCGIKAVAEKNKATLLNFDAYPLMKVENKNNKILKEVYITKVIKEVDLIINVPKLKTHVLTKYTGAVKNLYGCITGGAKSKYHKLTKTAENFSLMLVELYKFIKPQLNIMDAILGMEGEGPASGDAKKTGLILASENAPALDFVASEIIGFKADGIFTNKIAKEQGLVDKIEIIGEKIKIPYKKPAEMSKIEKIGSLIFKNVPFREIVVNKNKCIKCRICAKKCPVKAITLKPYPIIDKNKCIQCYCCHECCPEHAILLEKPFLRKIMEKSSQLISKT